MSDSDPPQLPPGPQDVGSVPPVSDPNANPSASAFGSKDQASEDREHLSLLVVFHYVLGGLSALGACVPIIHLVIGLVFVSGAIPIAEHDPNFPQAFGWFFVIIALVAIVCGMTLAICILLAGRNLQRRTGYTFCFVVACIQCVMFPFGTALGVFTIIVLNRPTVKNLFGKSGGGGGGDAAAEFERSVG
jgi:hypothetical protein